MAWSHHPLHETGFGLKQTAGQADAPAVARGLTWRKVWGESMLVEPMMTSCCSVAVSLCATRTSDRVIPPTMNTTMRRPRAAAPTEGPPRLYSLHAARRVKVSQCEPR